VSRPPERLRSDRPGIGPGADRVPADLVVGQPILAPWLFGWEEPGLGFDAALHLGTLVAVFAFFRDDIVRMVRAVPLAARQPMAVVRGVDPGNEPRFADARLGFYLILGSIPGGVAGLAVQGGVDDFFHDGSDKGRAIAVIAVLLAVFGFLLLLAERLATHRRSLKDVCITDAVVVGIAQAVALIPGVSRSGITLTAGLFRGIARADAARFSFLLGSAARAGRRRQGFARPDPRRRRRRRPSPRC
jgi:undecaprenyl-diphosphatase